MKKDEEKHILKVSQLRPYQKNINLVVKVVRLKPEKEVFFGGKKHRISEVLVGDETGCVTMSLWDNEIERASEGTVIKIENAYTNLYREGLRLRIGKYGSFEVIEKEISHVNFNNNLSQGYVQTHYKIPDSIANVPAVKPSKLRRKRR